MHYDLIIISDLVPENELLSKFKYIKLHSGHYLINPFETDNHLSFDYLIFSDLRNVSNLDIMIDNNQVITNCYFQTNYEHLFAIGAINGSDVDLDSQLQIILEFLINPI